MIMDNWFQKFVRIHYGIHLMTSLIIRFGLIGYSIYHDKVYTIPYTDVDYRVFTDASRYVLLGESPYERHTYRYSPLLAIALIPNLKICFIFGKILFSVIDILVALLIRKILIYNIEEYSEFSKTKYLSIEGTEKSINDSKNVRSNHNLKKIKLSLVHDDTLNFIANISIIAWLYNPLTIAIATRGNCDSIAGLLVLTTIFCIQCKKKYFLGGLFHGLAIHFRLYPIFYSLTLFMFLSNYSYYVHPAAVKITSKKTVCKQNEEKRTIFKKKYLMYLIPNRNQISLVLGCLMSLVLSIGFFYYLYGFKFIYETYLYHFVRHDTRHNFSLYFYLQYLTAFIKNVPFWQNILMTLPQLVLIVVISVRYGLDKISFNFGIVIQTIVMVTYNTVLTSQYFVWIMVVLPLCIWQIKMSIISAGSCILVWFVAQGAWLFPAFLLEFKGQNTFIYVWLQGVAFFCANIAILGRLIMNHKPHDFKILKKY
ncbi:hypothetical protein WA026_013706 [Henosepilachna vigintioctopunctata]|uniref:GPI alpha-1,4-mannosyltransferase I, catalytic subunit n=1 Tax=Henosepilachna vigintioctopunctata TaxID=420089 RepID=A0AAW1UTM9_9CUCU